MVACRGEGDDGPRPNVVLISIDTLRSDHLGCYGYPRETSPAIDRLAEEGVLFENHVSSSPWTLPGHAAIFTSMSDSVHGCVDTDFALAPGFTTLAERFRDGGYRTAGFFAGPYLHPVFGLHQGFDHYENCTSYREVLDGGDVKDWAMDPEVMRSSHQDVTNPTVYGAGRKWMEEHRGAPFFVFLHLWDVHFDFIPPPPYDTMFDPDYDGEITGRNFFFDDRINAQLPQRDKDHLVALYDGEIAWTDSFIDRILDDLATWGIEEDTIVVITSDHGEEFFEHGGKAHRTTLFDEQIRVPLILRHPGRLEADVRVGAQTRSIDIAPTLLELAGLPRDEEMMGSSLVGLADGEPLGFDNAAVSELFSVGREFRSVRRLEDKVVENLRQNRRVWCDLEADPGERNLRGDFDAPGGREALKSYRRALELLDRSRAARPAEPVPPEIPPEVAEQLRKLGYVGDERKD